MTTANHLHLMLAEDRTRAVDSWVHDDATPTSASFTISEGPGTDFTVTGHPAALMATAAQLYRDLSDAFNGMGEKCTICRQHGLNRGEFAVPWAGWYAHTGCSEDFERAEDAGTEDALKALESMQS